MADISDVEQALVYAVTSTLYPGGPAQSSLLGMPCRIYRGWPNSATLNSDLGSGTVNITILADNESGRTTTRYLSEWQIKASTPGTVISTSGQSIYISGSPAVGDIVGALIDGTTYTYRITAGDTTDQVAANLGQGIQVNEMVACRQSIILVYNANTILTRVVCDNAASAETRRQEKDFRVVCWCPNPTVRDLVAAAIDRNLDQVPFLSLIDETTARVNYKNTNNYDQSQNALLYRRDLIYSVEYPTITVTQQPSMLFGNAVLNGASTYG